MKGRHIHPATIGKFYPVNNFPQEYPSALKENRFHQIDEEQKSEQTSKMNQKKSSQQNSLKFHYVNKWGCVVAVGDEKISGLGPRSDKAISGVGSKTKRGLR